MLTTRKHKMHITNQELCELLFLRESGLVRRNEYALTYQMKMQMQKLDRYHHDVSVYGSDSNTSCRRGDRCIIFQKSTLESSFSAQRNT